jgi:alkanesulfonate monooxygenase
VSIELNWYLPSHGDGRHLLDSGVNLLRDAERAPGRTRDNDFDYLVTVTKAIEYAGFHAVFVPTGSTCHDAWLLAAALARHTSTLKLLVALRPGLTLPALAAHSVQTLQSITNGRLLLHVVTGGSAAEQRGYGDLFDHERRYERTDEFLAVLREVWRGRAHAGRSGGYRHSGEFYQLEGAGLVKPLRTPPAIYFGGSSAPAERMAARHADVYLQRGDPPSKVRERIARVRDAATAQGRTLRFGYRVHIIARETEVDAWRTAERGLRDLPRETIDNAQRLLAASEATGQARMGEVARRSSVDHVRDLQVSPNLWAGVGLVRGGAGTALVGSYRQVAERIEELHALGVDSFILSGYPNLEEALRFGEEVAPLIRRRAQVGGRESAEVQV